MLLIGSQALKIHNPNFNLRSDADYDIILSREEGLKYRTILEDQLGKVDFLYTEDLNNSEAEDRFASSEAISFDGLTIKVATMHGLAVLKRSHLWRDYFFDKHIAMYHKYLSHYRYGLGDDEGYLQERIRLTQEHHKARSPNLNQSNDDFFDDAVKKVYDHDTLHEMLAYYDEPIYTRLKYPYRTDSAWCEKDLWEKLSYEDRCKCVAEEAYVIATERFMVPNDWDYSPRVAYRTALKKVCTTLTSGWFRDFAIDNYPAIINLEDLTKLTSMKERLQNVER